MPPGPRQVTEMSEMCIWEHAVPRMYQWFLEMQAQQNVSAMRATQVRPDQGCQSAAALGVGVGAAQTGGNVRTPGYSTPASRAPVDPGPGLHISPFSRDCKCRFLCEISLLLKAGLKNVLKQCWFKKMFPSPAPNKYAPGIQPKNCQFVTCAIFKCVLQ